MIERRFEFKYLINPVVARRAESFIKSVGMKADVNAPGGEYTVSSLYFDTPQKQDYYDKSGGFLQRTKIRARIYASCLNNDTKHVWLENKERHDAFTWKTRVKISAPEFEELLARGAVGCWRFFAGRDDQKEGELILSKMILGNRRPLLVVQYRRRPYLGSHNGDRIRMTFDTDLQVCNKPELRNLFSWTPIERGSVILEVKFSKELPAWWGTLVKFLELERVSFSKYGRAVEELRSFHPMPR